MATTHEISKPFARALERNRDELNRRFQYHSHFSGGLNGDELHAHLKMRVDPLIIEIEKNFPECVSQSTINLFEVSLELLSANYLGTNVIHKFVDQVWQMILPQSHHLISRNAGELAGSLSNAICNIVSQRGTRPKFWIHQMVACASECTTPQQLLDCGQVLGWLSGMVQYRRAAIEKAKSLPLNLQHLIFELDGQSVSDIASVFDDLSSSRWFNPVSDQLCSKRMSVGEQNISIVKTIGDFRGFDGPFLQPPHVNFNGETFVVSDSQATWQIESDIFGDLIHRIGTAPKRSGRKDNQILMSGPDKVIFDSKGMIQWQGVTASFPELSNTVSCANDGQTVAVTLSDSHRVYLLAVL